MVPQVIAFNVPLESKAAGLAATLQVPVHSHSIIYALVDAAKEMLEAPAVDPRGWAEIGRRLSRGWGRD